jgi:hypothetical protein
MGFASWSRSLTQELNLILIIWLVQCSVSAEPTFDFLAFSQSGRIEIPRQELPNLYHERNENDHIGRTSLSELFLTLITSADTG